MFHKFLIFIAPLLLTGVFNLVLKGNEDEHELDKLNEKSLRGLVNREKESGASNSMTKSYTSRFPDGLQSVIDSGIDRHDNSKRYRLSDVKPKKKRRSSGRTVQTNVYTLNSMHGDKDESKELSQTSESPNENLLTREAEDYPVKGDIQQTSGSLVYEKLTENSLEKKAKFENQHAPLKVESEPLECIEFNTELVDFTIAVRQADSYEKCAELCNTFGNGCQFYSYSHSDKSCHLKSEQAEYSKVAHVGFTSGRRCCHNDMQAGLCSPESTGSKCYKYGYLGKGSVLRSYYNIYSAESCHLHCRSLNTCVSWSYSMVNTKKCTLYYSDNLELGLAQKYYVSGPVKCEGQSEPKPTVICYKSNYTIVGEDVLDYPLLGLPEALECQKHCSNHPKCKYFTFRQVPGDSICYLKSGMTNLVSSDLWLVGPATYPEPLAPYVEGDISNIFLNSDSHPFESQFGLKDILG